MAGKIIIEAVSYGRYLVYRTTKTQDTLFLVENGVKSNSIQDLHRLINIYLSALKIKEEIVIEVNKSEDYIIYEVKENIGDWFLTKGGIQCASITEVCEHVDVYLINIILEGGTKK